MNSGTGPPNLWGFYITHNDAPQPVGLLWMSDPPVSETSTWQRTTRKTDKYPCPCGIRTHNLSRREAADRRLRPRGHWGRVVHLIKKKTTGSKVTTQCLNTYTVIMLIASAIYKVVSSIIWSQRYVHNLLPSHTVQVLIDRMVNKLPLHNTTVQ